MTSEKDIVERLRSSHPKLLGDAYWETIFAERREAAAEIERLRGEVAEAYARGFNDCAIEGTGRVKAAHARASEMRERAARLAENGEWTPDGDDPYCGKQIASAIRALTLPSGGGGYDHREAEVTDRSGNGADD